MTPRNLYLILHSRYPSEKAASLFAAKSAEAFAREGVQVVLLVPDRFGKTGDDPYEYYGIARTFTTVYLPVVDLFPVPLLKKIAFYVSYASFSLSVVVYLWWHRAYGACIYTNEALCLILASSVSKQTVYEMHDFPEQKLRFYQLLLSRARHVLLTNTWKLDRLKALFPNVTAKLFVEQNAVDLSEFPLIEKADARSALGVLPACTMVVYTGHLYAWKGVDTLARAAKLLQSDTLVYFVGGTERDIAAFSERYADVPNIRMAGHKPHREIPYWQAAADVLVLPNTGTEDIAKYYTSPMKLFEYMASMRPIVASDLPSVRELLNEKNAYLIPPDEPEALAKKIIEVTAHTTEAESRATQARRDVETHTWDARAKRILAELAV